MSVLKIFENTPGRPGQERQGSCRPSNGRHDFNVIFLNLQRGPWPGEGACGLGATGHPPRATRGLPPYISPGLHSLLI